MIGSVIRVKVCHLLAPSIAAASYTSALISCSPARISSAMNGVVFQTSAITTANREGQVSPVQSSGLTPKKPSSRLAMPSKAKMKNQSLAVTAVGIAHGTRMAARTRPRPRKVRFMIVANHSPSTISIATDTTVKNRVTQSAS